jgi:superfamily II DNA helicase RecQ
LTSAGEAIEEDEVLELQMKSVAVSAAKGRKKKKTAKGRRTSSRAAAPVVKAPARRGGAASAASAEDKRLEDGLRQWRLAEAKRLGVPAFRVLTDRALRAIAEGRPGTAAELLAIPGIGISTVEKYGAHIYRLVQSAGGAPPGRV